MVFADDSGEGSVGDAGADAGPGLAVVGRFVEARFLVVELVTRRGDVGGGVVVR